MVLKSKNQQKDDFQFSLLEDFLGYNSSSDKTKLDPRYMIRGSKNVYKKTSGTIASRPGLKRRGEMDTTEAGTVASDEWETSLGTKRYTRVTADMKLQVESDIVDEGEFLWYDLFETGTFASPAAVYTRFIFDKWWNEDEQTDRLVMTRGDGNVLHWTGAMALIASSTLNSLTKQGTETWAEAGFAVDDVDEKRIMVDFGGGDIREVTYTGGEGTTTLTGVSISSGAVTDLTSGKIAIQSVMVEAPPDVTGYKYDVVKIINNQAWYLSYTSRKVFISADVNSGGVLGFLNVVDSTTSHVYGDPDFIILDSAARGIGTTPDGKVIIFSGDSDMMVVTPNQNVTFSYTGTDGQTRLNFQKIEKKRLAGLTAAESQEFIDNFGDYLVWKDNLNQVRALGTFVNNASIRPAHLSLAVQEELYEDDFDGGHLRAIGDTIYLTAPNNGRDWMYQVREVLNDNGEIVSEKIWQPPQIRGLSRMAIMDGVVHGHSNAHPQVYQLWDTNQWTDDNPSEDNIPYSCVARFSYRQLAEGNALRSYLRRQGMLNFDKIYFEGYMSQGTYLNTRVLIEYQGAKHTLEGIINSPEDEDVEDSQDDLANFFTGNVVPSLGTSSLGEKPLGDGILEESSEQELVPKFRRVVGFQNINCFEYSIEVNSTEPDSRWELLCFGPNMARASQQPTFLRKKA